MKKIALIVFGAHLLFLFWMALWMPAKKQEKKPLQIRTTIATPPPPKTEIVKAKPTPPAPKKTVVKKQAPIKKPVVQKKPPIPKNLVNQLQESIAKIEKNRDKESVQTPLKTPTSIYTLKIDRVEGVDEKNFANELVCCLQKALDLPEIGAVKIALTLKKEGGFVKMQILHSESKQNEKCIEDRIKMLQFPSFSGTLKKEKEHTFVITFCNS